MTRPVEPPLAGAAVTPPASVNARATNSLRIQLMYFRFGGVSKNPGLVPGPDCIFEPAVALRSRGRRRASPRRWIRVLARLVIVLVFAACVPGTVCAQFALEVPPDARSEGMGGAEVVLDPGPWAAWGNVWALGLFSGSGVVGTRVQLVPELSDDVYYSFGSAALAIP